MSSRTERILTSCAVALTLALIISFVASGVADLWSEYNSMRVGDQRHQEELVQMQSPCSRPVN